MIFKPHVASFETRIECSPIDKRCYSVYDKYKDGEQSANLLASTNRQNIEFIRYLKNKYILSTPHMEQSEFVKRKKMTENLLEMYNPDAVQENVPADTKNTSYVMNKGDIIAFCLRKPDRSQFEDMSKLSFVALHELTHLTSRDLDANHSDEFWKNFKIILEEATAGGFYIPVNYKEHPINYCGLPVYYNPMFDKGL